MPTAANPTTNPPTGPAGGPTAGVAVAGSVAGAIATAEHTILALFTDLHDSLALLARARHATAGNGERAAYVRGADRATASAHGKLVAAREIVTTLVSLADPGPRYADPANTTSSTDTGAAADPVSPTATDTTPDRPVPG